MTHSSQPIVLQSAGAHFVTFFLGFICRLPEKFADGCKIFVVDPMLASGMHSLMFSICSYLMHVIHLQCIFLSFYSMNLFEGGSLKVLVRIVYEPSCGIESQTDTSLSKNSFSMIEFESRLYFKLRTKILFRDLLNFHFIN